MVEKMHQTHFTEVASLIQQAQQTALRNVNKAMIELYWQIGQYIHIQVSQKTWGKAVVTELAKYITTNLP
jgi:DUF1016 N-terminal domain